MKARRVNVATGKPGKPVTETAVRQTPAEDRGAASPPGSRVPLPAPAPASPAVTLQVASFAARDNAERALAMLEEAGIRDARLFDAVASGQKVWRLRVGPVAAEQVAELSATVTGLGFGRPNIVRD
jgi:rare lipoprotein A